MKKNLLYVFLLLMLIILAGCGSSEPASKTGGDAKERKFVTVTTINSKREKIEIKVPYQPKRIAVMDLSALDILDNLKLSDNITGVSKGSSIDYLQKYITNKSLLNLGTIKDANLEAVLECNPDVIIIGPRLLKIYDELAKIAPVICLAIDTKDGVVKSTGKNAELIASMFGMEDNISGLMANYDKRIAALSGFAKGKTAIVCMANAGGIGILGNDGRCSIIGAEAGFKNIGIDAKRSTSTHGNEASFEYLVSVNPDYIFVMDRDAAIGTEGAKLAQDIMDNELVKMTSACKNGNIVYLKHSDVWYTAEGGITALGIMLSDLEDKLIKKQ